MYHVLRSRLKVLVTGASGFVGTHLVKRLVNDGHNVYSLVRTTSNVEELEQEDIKTGRNVEHPTAQDLNWIKSRVKKIDGLSDNGFIKKIQKIDH